MYGQSRYGGTRYAAGHGSVNGQEGQFFDLARYVPPFVAELSELAEIYRTEGYEAGRLRAMLGDVIRQCFVQTATWGLILWEKEYGITTNYFLTYEQRREVILAKMRGQETTTVEAVRRTAVSITGVEADIIENYAEYCFLVSFTGAYGVPPNIQQLVDILEEIKPAHLGYAFHYRYVTWDEAFPYIWNDVRLYTWAGLRVKQVEKFARWKYLEKRSWRSVGGHTWQQAKGMDDIHAYTPDELEERRTPLVRWGNFPDMGWEGFKRIGWQELKEKEEAKT